MKTQRAGGGSCIHGVAFAWSLLIPLVLTLSACSSNEKSKSEYGSLRWEQRINKQMKDPHSIRSPFQQELFNASRGAVKTSKFKTGEFHANQSFSGGDDKFKASAFSQSDKATSYGKQTFSGADDQNRFGRGIFKTSRNHADGKVNSASGKVSPSSDDSFPTIANPAALKAASNSKRPVIEDMGTPSYTEDEVRSILQR